MIERLQSVALEAALWVGLLLVLRGLAGLWGLVSLLLERTAPSTWRARWRALRVLYARAWRAWRHLARFGEPCGRCNGAGGWPEPRAEGGRVQCSACYGSALLDRAWTLCAPCRSTPGTLDGRPCPWCRHLYRIQP